MARSAARDIIHIVRETRELREHCERGKCSTAQRRVTSVRGAALLHYQAAHGAPALCVPGAWQIKHLMREKRCCRSDTRVSHMQAHTPAAAGFGATWKRASA